MLTLTQITGKARRNEPLTDVELRLAVCAYDVMLAQMHLNEEQVKEFFIAAELPPEEYIGWGNHPANEDFVEWYKANVNTNISQILNRTKEILDHERSK